MDALKALKAQRDALKQQLHEVAGDSKHVKKTALEEARIRKIQEEEAREREEKVQLIVPGRVHCPPSAPLR